MFTTLAISNGAIKQTNKKTTTNQIQGLICHNFASLYEGMHPHGQWGHAWWGPEVGFWVHGRFQCLGSLASPRF